MTQSVEVQRYKPEGRGFDSRLCQWNFSLSLSFDHTIALGSTQPQTGVSARNIFWVVWGGKGGRCVGLAALLTSCADCLEIWEPQPSGSLRAVFYLLLFLQTIMKINRCKRRKVYNVCVTCVFSFSADNIPSEIDKKFPLKIHTSGM